VPPLSAIAVSEELGELGQSTARIAAVVGQLLDADGQKHAPELRPRYRNLPTDDFQPMSRAARGDTRPALLE